MLLSYLYLHRYRWPHINLMHVAAAGCNPSQQNPCQLLQSTLGQRIGRDEDTQHVDGFMKPRIVHARPLHAFQQGFQN